jgi:hypothetical protein
VSKKMTMIEVFLSESCNPVDEPDYKYQKTIQLANSHDVVLLYLQYDIYNSPIPAVFVCSAPSITTGTRVSAPPLCPRAISLYQLKDCLTIVLTSEVGRGTTGVVHCGTLEVESSDESVPLDVVGKLSFSSEQRDALRSEYEVYRQLGLKGVLKGITTALGFFDESEGGPCALVMPYTGVSLVMEPERVLSSSDRYGCF